MEIPTSHHCITVTHSDEKLNKPYVASQLFDFYFAMFQFQFIYSLYVMISFRWYYKGQSRESNTRSHVYKISEYCYHFVLKCLRASILLLCTAKQRSREILKMFVTWSLLMFILCIISRLNEVQSNMNCANVKSSL